MSIQIIENEKPPLRHTPMLVDGCLHERLNQYEVLSLINCHTTTLYLGAPKSGKSSLIYSLFNCKEALRKLYHKIYVFIPSASRSSVKKDIFETLAENQQFSELTYENLAYVLEDIKSLPKHYHKCIIFDDQGAYLRNPELQKLFKDLCFLRRHLGTSVHFLAQTYFSVPKEIRRCFQNAFIFKVPIGTMTTIFDELVEEKKDIIIPLMKLVYDKPYNFLFINFDSQKMFKNWDRLLIT